MKKFLTFSSLLAPIFLFAQNTPASIATEMPNISPPSPTVASLMKFEEVPVNNYTGIPEISIPLYGVETLSKDIKMDLSLKYHPSSIAVKEVAGYTGLGWNLLAGGSISRTVRGLPDEVYKQGDTGGGPNAMQIGIYNSDIGSPPNNYYQCLNLFGNISNSNQQEIVSDFLWGAFEKGIYDSEHDLYQYNFMGHTGRFYLEMNAIGVIVPVKLDNDNAIKIEVDITHDTSSYNERYIFNSFTLFDDKGYKYIFTAKEYTTETGANSSKPFGSLEAGIATDFSAQIGYVSAFHLTDIYDNNEQKLVEISYDESVETTEDVSSIINYFVDPTMEATVKGLMQAPNSFEIWGLLPKTATIRKTRSVVTKKIKEIAVVNKARINLGYDFDRQDSNLNNDAAKLTEMYVYSWKGEQVKHFTFSYDYATIYSGVTSNNNVSRLILTDVSEWNTSNSESLNYKLNYKNTYVTSRVSTDYWGYFKLFGPGKETDPDNCTTGVLTEMILPTKGRIVFDFGPNTYSYIGDQAVTDFTTIEWLESTPIHITLPPGQSFGEQPISLGSNLSAPLVIVPNSPDPGSNFRVLNDGDTEEQDVSAFGFSDFNDGTSSAEIVKINTSYNYRLRYERGSTLTASTIDAFIFRGNYQTNSKQFLYGGGVRINKISYFDTDSVTPSKEKHFNYNFFSNSNRSSGALTFAKPVFEYLQSRRTFIPNSNILPSAAVSNPLYKTVTSTNNLLYLRTKGSDVGYKNVTVWETNNGKSEYVYTTPIDYPEEDYTITYPFVPPINIDYKRGLLLSEKHYKQQNNTYSPVSETLYTYPENNMDEVVVEIGITGVNNGTCPASTNYDLFSYFKYCDSANCTPLGWQAICEPDDFLGFREVKVAYGWPKLTSKITKEYFYNDSQTPNIVTTTETFIYSALNKKIVFTSKTNSLSETLSTTYTYDTTFSARNRIGEIKSIETSRNNVLLDKKSITYSSSWEGNHANLPSVVWAKKGEASDEARLQFEVYDEYSNPVQAKLSGGTPVVYIWGYNSSLPVAIIENINYNQLDTNIISAIKNASLQNASYSEANLLTKLQDLRASLPDATLITTITHKPLVGVSTMTDPKGIITHYYYDTFNRLEKVTDADNNIVSENHYNYKP